MSSEAVSRRKTLQRATQEAHVRLDRLIDGAGLLFNRKRYEGYLQATWRARRPSEVALDASGVVSIYAAWPQRRLSGALTQDILDLARVPPDDDDRPPNQLTLGQCLGVLYVLEGSALGARILRDRASAIGMTASFGARHMMTQTSEPQAWSAFLRLLEAIQLDETDEELCVGAAVAAFSHYEHAFQHLAGSD